MEKKFDEDLIIIKYQTPDGLYDFKCLDSTDYLKIDDFTDDMNEIIRDYEGDGCKILWIRQMINFTQRYENHDEI